MRAGTPTKDSVPIRVPKDIWQPLIEIRAQLDDYSPGPPTPIEETLREIVSHYKHCAISEQEIERFRERSKAWKK
jgi:hypothetical protein